MIKSEPNIFDSNDPEVLAKGNIIQDRPNLRNFMMFMY